MRLQPNIGSDRSWVWKVAADYAEQPPTSETLAIRFANAESEQSIHRGARSYNNNVLQTRHSSRKSSRRRKRATPSSLVPQKRQRLRRPPPQKRRKSPQRPRKRRRTSPRPRRRRKNKCFVVVTIFPHLACYAAWLLNRCFRGEKYHHHSM